ncbi:MAG TPA: response regulator [Chitinophagaceae bacterium]|jgi:two-component system response regulator
MSGHILFVEDDSDDVFLIQHAAKNAGLTQRLHFSANGKEAVEYLLPLVNSPALLPSLIFLDLNMPLMGGLEFLNWMRSQAALQTIPVIILTTSENPADIAAAYKAGANAFLVKPSVISELANMLIRATTLWLKDNGPMS